MSGRLPPTEHPRCGSPAGYHTHQRCGEDACAACLRAIADRQAALLAALPPEVRAARHARKNARRAALAVVARRHRGMYARLLAEERTVLRKQYAEQAPASGPRLERRIYHTARERALSRVAAHFPDLYRSCLKEQFASRGITP